jgi:WD40 repeat protein
MARQLVWLLMACLVLVLVLPLVAVGVEPEAEIARLIKQLGDDDVNKREAATKGLVAIGEGALDALRKAATSDDPEVRLRAEQIAAAIGVEVDNKLYGPELCFTGHDVSSVWVSSDGKRLLTSGGEKLRLWDTYTGQQLHAFEGQVSGAEFSPDGKHILSWSLDKTVRLWDSTTGKELRKWTGPAVVSVVALGPECKVIGAGDDGKMKLWDLNTGKQSAVFTGHPEMVYHVAYSAQARLAVTRIAFGRTIRLWDLETDKELRKLTGHTEWITCASFSADGKRLVSAGYDGTLRIWDVQSGKELKQIQTRDLNRDPIGPHCAAFSPDGKRVVSGGPEDLSVRVWDAESGTEVYKYEGHNSHAQNVAFFPDGNRIVSADQDGTVRIWRAPR